MTDADENEGKKKDAASNAARHDDDELGVGRATYATRGRSAVQWEHNSAKKSITMVYQRG